jgi:hypothetical protein
MSTIFSAVLLCSIASAGTQSPATGAPPAVHASTAAAAPVSAAAALGVSTYTVSTLYTGDQVRDPFLSPSMSGGGAVRVRGGALDIHSLELRGILKDAKSDFAIFSGDDGATFILRGGRLYNGHNKRVPGITGRIKIKQKRAELVTADKDVQIYSLGESSVKKAKDGESEQSDETEETGSGRSP